MIEARRLYAAAFLRAASASLTGVLLGLHLARLGLSESTVGAVVGSGLAGAAAASALMTFRGDDLGRRRSLLGLALLGGAGLAAAAFLSSPAALCAVAFLGMLNGMGRDRGAALVLEQAALPAFGSDAQRTRLFAYYNLAGDAGHAIGALLAGLPSVLSGMTPVASGRLTLGIGALLLLAALPLYAGLSAKVEAEPRPERRAPASPATRRLLARMSALFAVDALGSGFLPAALLSFFFFERFGASAAAVSVLFFFARVLNAVSHLGAAWLATRIGLVNTMVFTHIPSSVLLASVAIAPSFPVAAVLFLLREGLVEMDVPTRQSYLMAVVPAADRSLVSGVTGLARLASWAIAPPIAGLLMQYLSRSAPLVIGAALKIAYDVALYVSFRNVRPPEEDTSGGGAPRRPS